MKLKELLEVAELEPVEILTFNLDHVTSKVASELIEEESTFLDLNVYQIITGDRLTIILEDV